MDQEEVLKVLKQIDKKLSNCECKCVCKKFKMKKPKKSQKRKPKKPIQRSFAEQIAYEKDMRKQVGAIILAEKLSVENIKNLSESKLRDYLSGQRVQLKGARGRTFSVSILDDSMRRDTERNFLQSIKNIALEIREEKEISNLFSQMNIPRPQTLEERIKLLKIE